MFVLKGLGRIIWGDPDKTELVQIASGQLYLVRPKNSVKGTSECIFKDAAASVLRTTTEFNYQLVIQRAYEEGEEQLYEDDDGELRDGPKDERATLLDESLHFRSTIEDGTVVLAWRDLSGDPGDVYKFICDPATPPGVSHTFELVVYQCMWERKYRRSHEDATEADLEQFNFAHSPIPSASPATSVPVSPMERRGDVKALKSASTKAPPPFQRPSSRQEAETLASVSAQLHLFDATESVFMLQDAHVTASVVETGPWEYWLQVTSGQKVWISQQMDPEMNPVFNYEHLSFIWNYFDEQSVAYSWLLRFESNGTEEKFQEGVMRALWERLNHQRWMKSNQDEREYVLQAFQGDVEMPDESDDESEQDDTDTKALVQSETYDEDEEYDDPETGVEDANQNSALAVGYKSERSFVVRGDKIGVFRHTRDDGLEYSTSINHVQTPSGKSFVPSKVMLHQQDASLVLQNPTDPESLYRMDLEVGKVVENWKIRDDMSLRAFGPESKFAQMTPEQSLLGVSHNSLFRIDPRLSGNKLVESQNKQYVSKNQFSALATTEAGYIAVASEKGDIRLFDRVGIRAKVSLPALGEPITGLDVSADGRWVLATCSTYLLLIDVRIKDGKYEGQLGFVRSFGKDVKPRPRRLQLKPQHVAWLTLTGRQRMSFTPAKFNTGLNETETTIVTSVGPYVITWDFRKVQENHAEPYRIRKYTDDVVSDNFRFGQDKNIVVALPQDVTVVTKKQLSRPTRDSFGAPAAAAAGLKAPSRGSSSLRSTIVNSPYSG